MIGSRIVAILDDGTDGIKYKIKNTNYTIGRHSSCDICIKNITVSRQHCQIIQDDKYNYWLIPLQRILLNGKMIIKPHKLNHEDIITINTYHFRYEQDTNFLSPQSTSSSSISPLSDDCKIISLDRIKDI